MRQLHTLPEILIAYFLFQQLPEGYCPCPCCSWHNETSLEHSSDGFKGKYVCTICRPQQRKDEKQARNIKPYHRLQRILIESPDMFRKIVQYQCIEVCLSYIMAKYYFLKITKTDNIFDILRQNQIADIFSKIQEFVVLSALSSALSNG